MVVAAQHGGDFPALCGMAALRCRGVHGPGRLFQQVSGLVQVVGDSGRVCGERGDQRDDRVRARLPYLDEVPSRPVTSRVTVLQMPFGGQRVRRFEQCLELVKRLWTGDNVSFENDICKLNNVTMTCRPIQQPHPPIWFAANNDRAVRRAARLGDSWFVNPHATIPEITRQLALYRGELARLRKPFPAVLPYAREIYCAKDTPTALAMAGPYLAEKYRTYATWGQDEVLPGNDSFSQPFEALLRDRFVLGSPEECYQQLRPCWEEAEANFLIFRTHWSGMPVGHALASMRLISDELLPALRRITPPPAARC